MNSLVLKLILFTLLTALLSILLSHLFTACKYVRGDLFEIKKKMDKQSINENFDLR